MSDTAPEGCKVPSGRWRNAPFKKRSEYAARGIAHYWIVDPQDRKFICLELIDGLYEEKVIDTNRQTILLNNPFNLEVDIKQLFS